MLKPPNNPSKFPTQEQNWAMLIFQVADGNEFAFSALYDDTSQLVYGLAFRILADRTEAEEVTIEVYVQVWRKAIDYNPDRSTPSAWLLMLTRSRAIDRMRSDTRRPKLGKIVEVDAPAPISNPEETVLAVEQRER